MGGALGNAALSQTARGATPSKQSGDSGITREAFAMLTDMTLRSDIMSSTCNLLDRDSLTDDNSFPNGIHVANKNTP